MTSPLRNTIAHSPEKTQSDMVSSNYDFSQFLATKGTFEDKDDHRKKSNTISNAEGGTSLGKEGKNLL